MKQHIDTFSNKITLLNQTILDSMTEKDSEAIIKNFTEAGIKILEADFGFAWWKLNQDKEYRLAYKSSNTPYDPPQPRKKAGNYIATKTKKPFFDSDVNSAQYEFSIRKYLKSYIIIPIFYKDYMYGNLVFCYKNRHLFTKDQITLSNTIGNSAAQSITVHRLINTDILLAQEKIKTEFIANATHELRTPLAIMRGNADLALEVKNTHTSHFKETALKAIRDEIAHLSEILSNLAILTSKNGHHKNVFHLTEVDLISLVNQIIKRLRVLLNKKKITVKIATGKNKQLFITGDKEYLEKLFLNLIRNAIIYGKERGKIMIDIQKEGKKVILKVEDNGLGISREDLPHIFERFYRSEQARMTTTIGTGLGLAIAKLVVNTHGGDISVKSQLGKGTVFKVSLPIKVVK